MVVSLLGIIFIQYKWIQNTVTEKQKLIDNQVVDGVAKVEVQLNDLRGIKLFKEKMHMPLRSIKNKSQNITVITERDSNALVEIKIIGEENAFMTSDEHELIFHQREIRPKQNDSMVFVFEEGNVDHILQVMDKFKFEDLAQKDDIRLDSSQVSALLTRELEGVTGGQKLNWGVYDFKAKSYLIKPANQSQMDYNIPLFSTDILNPRRYELQLNLNANDIIWREIKAMTMLSFLFLIIITSVFIFSIRLIIKHKKISQIKSDFINNMTHEFKTPLASISLAADSLVHPNAILTDDYLKQYVEVIQHEKRKLNSHVERILEVAALNKDALKINIETLDLSEIINKAIHNLGLLIEKNKAQVRFSSAIDLKVKANAEHLENIVVNLIENGIKYGGDEPEITVDVKTDNEQAILKIIDRGIGMTNKQLNRVFDNFYRVQTGDLHNSKGFGLGLSYCKLVIEKMGGTIGLQSKLNKGTTAIVKLSIER